MEQRPIILMAGTRVKGLNSNMIIRTVHVTAVTRDCLLHLVLMPHSQLV